MHWATPQERRTLGQARRKQVGRQQHNDLKPKARQSSALELVARSMRGRVPSLIQLKYQLMAASPLGYFRGAVPVMAADLSVLPNTGIICQLCGDAHVRNLGAFAAPDGRLVFDINDFDETIRGPFEWDLKRMAASLVLAGRESGHKEASARQAVENSSPATPPRCAPLQRCRASKWAASRSTAWEGLRRCMMRCSRPNGPRRCTRWRS